MKGVVFSLLEQIVVRDYGEDTWDDLLDEAGLDGGFTTVGSYPDEQMMRLVAAASSSLDIPPDAVLRWFGRNALPVFATEYPHLFAPHDSSRSFLLTLNDIIHPEVRKLYPGAEVPEFDFDASAKDLVCMRYRSSRGLCAFGEGLILGAADHFGEQVSVEQPRCVHRGDDHCLYEIRFIPEDGASSAGLSAA